MRSVQFYSHFTNEGIKSENYAVFKVTESTSNKVCLKKKKKITFNYSAKVGCFKHNLISSAVGGYLGYDICHYRQYFNKHV